MKRLLLILLALLLLVAAALVLILPSEWLRQRIHTRVVAELTKATGGQVTLGGFSWNWSESEVSIRDLVVRGREPLSSPPLIRVPAATVRLKLLSYLSPNIDLKELRVTKPEFHLITFPDGSTNLPGPATTKASRPFLEQFLKLAIDRFVVDEGLFTWDLRKYPFNIKGERLDLNFLYETTAAQTSYRGFLASRQLRIAGWRFNNAAFDVDTEVVIQKDRIRFLNGHLRQGNSVVNAAGELLPVTPDWKELKLESDFSLTSAMPDLVALVGLPLQPVGTFDAKGHVSWQQDVTVTADAAGNGWAIDAGGQRFRDISWKAPLTYSKGRAETNRLNLSWLNGTYRGRASTDFNTYEVAGTAADFRLRDLAPLLHIQAPPADTTIIGPIKVTGTGPHFTALARVTLLAAQPDRPFTGSLNFQYAARTRSLLVEPSYLDLSGTRVDLNGDLARGLRVSLTTRNLAALPFAAKLPIQLESEGEVGFHGVATGSLENPRVQGDLQLSKFRFEKRVIESFSSTIDATSQGVTFAGLDATLFGADLSGRATVALQDWAFTKESKYTAQIDVKNADVARLARETGVKLNATGTAQATLDISGAGDRFNARGPVEIANTVVAGQPLGRLRLDASTDGQRTQVGQLQATLGGRPVKVTGDYREDGSFTATVAGEAIPLEQVPAWKEAQPGVNGLATAHLELAGRMVNDKPQWTRISGDAVLRQLTWEQKPLGELTLTAQPAGATSARLTVAGTLRDSAVSANGTVNLTPGLPVSLTFAVAPLSFAKLEDLRPVDAEGQRTPWPFEGGVTLSGTLSGPLEEPRLWKGTVKGEQLTIAAREAPAALKRDFAIRNTGPLELDFDERGLNFRSVRLEAKETNLQAAGLLAWNEKTAWNLRLTGQVNLAVLSSFQPDLNATGVSSLDATIRGTRQEPLLNGRLIFSNASFFLRNVANGLENVSGRVLFDKTRARIESFTAESGGGRIGLTGFVSFERDLGYQLQANVDNVRVRYPTGVSTAVNASLALTGSRARSLLSGAVTIIRANISAQTDIGTMLTESQKPSAPVRIENEFLREMQFDIRIDTAQDAELTTSLTQNVQAELNLRVRGTPARPAILGRLAFTQGEINFFGSKYIIDRGEMNFFNPTKIEPVINFDLQTRVRGVLVTLTFAGPASKINLAYRSDPPLQPNEIVALLAVGRTPTGGVVGGGSSVQNPGILSGSATALLGQAATTPITGRLQRLFGLRSLRIDPQITGLENSAQARLTLEQQVSRDVVVTFITNLNRTQQQIVSVEWDFSREWSAIAIRDENGVFGMDFFYRKRFK